MKTILIPFFEINGTDSYPDSVELFGPFTLLDWEGALYWTFTYEGNKIFYGERPYSEYQQWLDSQPPVTGIHKITTRAFHQRFTSGERKLLRQSEEDAAIDLLEELQFARYVYTKDPSIKDKLEALVDIDILLEDRPASLLVDGSPSEAYD